MVIVFEGICLKLVFTHAIRNTKFFCASMAGEFPGGNVYVRSVMVSSPSKIGISDPNNARPLRLLTLTGTILRSCDSAKRHCLAILQVCLWVLVIGEPQFAKKQPWNQPQVTWSTSRCGLLSLPVNLKHPKTSTDFQLPHEKWLYSYMFSKLLRGYLNVTRPGGSWSTTMYHFGVSIRKGVDSIRFHPFSMGFGAK